ncbi:MAG: LPP20 family lipoprotein [Pseudomonadota bacterium]
MNHVFFTKRAGGLMLFVLISMMAAGPAFEASAQSEGQIRLLTRRAAKVDALRNLLEVIYGLQIDARTKVRDFATESDVIRARLSATVQGAREIDYRVQPDGTAEVTVEVTLGAVQDILGRRLLYDRETIEATGYGAPPGPAAAAPTTTFSGRALRAKGFGVPPPEQDLSPAEKSLLAKRAGKLDALRNLAEQVYGVRISGNTLVRDFATQSDEIRSRVFSYIQGARVVSEQLQPDGSYQVEVEIEIEPLRALLGVR